MIGRPGCGDYHRRIPEIFTADRPPNLRNRYLHRRGQRFSKGYLPSTSLNASRAFRKASMPEGIPQ